MANGAPIWFATYLNNAGLKNGQSEADRIFNKLQGGAEDAGSGIEAAMKKAGAAVGAYLSVNAFANFARQMVDVRGQFQQLEIAFGTMLKSGDKAKKLMSDLSEFAATTPFGLQSSASAAKQLLAYGSSVETLIDEMRMLGDVAAGTSQPIGDLVYLYGTLRTQGRAYMMDIRQFAGRGIPIYDELAKVLGVSKDRVNEFVSAGKVGFAEVEQAFKNMTSSGGMYGGLMEAQSKSVTGRIEQLKDAVDIMFNEMGKASEGAVYGAISGAASLVENYEKVGKVLVGIIATYGAYRSALILATVATKGWTAAELIHYNVLLIVEKAQKLLNRTMLSNPLVLITTLVVGLVATMWALSDSATAAERAQERLNKRQSEFNEQERSRRARIDELIRIIQDETQTLYAQITAYEELQRLSPALTNAYTREQIAVTELAAANKTLNEEQDKRNYDELITNIDNTTKALDNLRKQRESILNQPILTQADASWLSKLASEETEYKALLTTYRKDLEEHNRRVADAEFNALPPAEKIKIKEEQLAKIRSEFERVKAVIEEEEKKMADRPYYYISPQLRAQFSGLRSQMGIAEAELGALKESDTKTIAEPTEEQKKQWAAEAKRRKEQAEKDAKDLTDTQRKYEDEVAQARVDAMNDGLEKVLAQNELNFQREKAQIGDQYSKLSDAERQFLIDAAQSRKTRADQSAKDAVLADMMSFADRYEKIIKDTNAKIKDAQMAGASLDSFGVLSDQENEAINRLAEEYAAKSADYEAFMRSVADASIEEIQAHINNAETLISQIIEGGIGDEEIEKYLGYVARLNALKDQLKNDKPDTSPGKESERDWKKLYSTLQKVEREFGEIGESVGGTAEEAIKTAGTIASSMLSSISAITQLANWSITATKMAAQGASKAIIAVEKASVILAVIGAVMKAVTAITGLFKDNEEQLRKAADAARGYEQALREIDVNRRLGIHENVFGTDGIGRFTTAVEIAAESLKTINDVAAGLDLSSFFDQLKSGEIGVFDFIERANGIEATFDGRSKWNKLVGSGNHKIKNYAFDVNEFINTDGSLKLEELQDWLNRYGEGLEEWEKEIVEDLISAGNEYVKAQEAQTAYLNELWGDLAGSIADNMIEAFLETGDAAANLGDLVDDVAKNMAKSMIVDELMSGIFNDDLQNKLSNLLKSGNQTGANNLIKNAIDSAGQLAPYFESIMESVGLVAGVAEDAENEARTSASQGFAQASQDSIDKIDGILTNIQNHTYGIFELMKSGGSNGSGITLSALEAPVLNIAEMMRTNQQIQQANTDNILGRLTNIDMNTRPIAEMQKDIHYMRARTDDMADSLDKFTRG